MRGNDQRRVLGNVAGRFLSSFLDDEGTQAYCDALETIQMRYKDLKIMAITHDPTFKARFPQNVEVIKTDDGSKVIFE